LEEGDPLAAMLELEDRVDAVLGMQARHLASPSFGRDPNDDVAEKAHDRACGNIDVVTRRGAQMNPRFDERLALRVEFEDRVGGTRQTAGPGSRRGGRTATGDG
jgi:hypothetical protein